MTDPPGKSNAIARYGPAARVIAISDLSLKHSLAVHAKRIALGVNDM